MGKKKGFEEDRLRCMSKGKWSRGGKNGKERTRPRPTLGRRNDTHGGRETQAKRTTRAEQEESSPHPNVETHGRENGRG